MVDLSSQSGRSIKFKLYSFTHTFFNQVPVFCLFRSLYFLFAFSLIFTFIHLIIAASNVRMFLVRTSFFEPGVVKRQTTLNTEFALAFVCFLVRKISFVILRFLEIEMFLSFVRAVAIFSISFIRDGFERVQKKTRKTNLQIFGGKRVRQIRERWKWRECFSFDVLFVCCFSTFIAYFPSCLLVWKK